MDIQWLKKTGPCAEFLAGQMISCYIGDNPNERAMYYLIKGSVDVFKTITGDDTEQLQSMKPGNVFGGEEFFYGDGDTTYIADTDVLLFAITEKSFFTLAKEKPDILMEILRGAYAGGRELVATPETQQVPEKPSAMAVSKTEIPKVNTSPPPPMIIRSDSIFPDGHKGYPGITHPEFTTILFNKEYVCPLCKKKFSDYKVARSKLFMAEPIRFDLRKKYRGFQTEWYDIITCHHCYFSTYYVYYENPKPILKQKIEEQLKDAKGKLPLDFIRERDLDFVFAQHYLALICSAGYLSTAKQIAAKIFASLSWLYEDIGDTDLETDAASRAADAYEEMYMTNRLTPVQEQITCMTIAGMLYRAKRFDNIKKYLFTVKTTKMGDRSYIKMAEDLIELMDK